MRRETSLFFAATLGSCAQIGFAPVAQAGPHDVLIARYAAANGVPERLVHRVIQNESRGDARAVYHGNYGLMQIRLGTARGIGYQGDAAGLLDVDTNLTYAVKYLAGAYRAAGCEENRAVSYYMRGYYGTARLECPASSRMEVAQGEMKLAAKIKRQPASAKSANAAAAEPIDVIKPKVVRTETIAPSKSRPAPARPVGAFEPKRVAPPSVQPSASTAKTDKVESTGEQFGLASVPLPPQRPELETSPQQEPVRQARRLHGRAGRKAIVATEDPTGVVTFLKRLVTPDSKKTVKYERRSRGRRAVRADANGLSYVQPPL
jgi:hypothetical protein